MKKHGGKRLSEHTRKCAHGENPQSTKRLQKIPRELQGCPGRPSLRRRGEISSSQVRSTQVIGFSTTPPNPHGSQVVLSEPVFSLFFLPTDRHTRLQNDGK